MIVTDSQSKEKRASSDFEDTGDVSSGKQQKLERLRCCNMLFQEATLCETLISALPNLFRTSHIQTIKE